MAGITNDEKSWKRCKVVANLTNDEEEEEQETPLTRQ
jgi:hypothetical protein